MARKGSNITYIHAFWYAETSEQGLQFVEANAEELPFESDSLDGYTIAFGIRNVTHIDRALSEAHRVRPMATREGQGVGYRAKN